MVRRNRGITGIFCLDASSLNSECTYNTTIGRNILMLLTGKVSQTYEPWIIGWGNQRKIGTRNPGKFSCASVYLRK